MKVGPQPRITAVVLALAACSSSSSTSPATGIAGTWSGSITRTNPSLTYSPGDPVNCGGTLTQTAVSGNTYTYSEHINSGTVANCVDGGQVEATVNGNSLAWVWTLPSIRNLATRM